MATIAIHQPNYLPWLGYFYKIANSDVFVFLDDVQFSKNSYTNRVQVFGKDEKMRWLTVPVSAHSGQSINEIFSSSIILLIKVIYFVFFYFNFSYNLDK